MMMYTTNYSVLSPQEKQPAQGGDVSTLLVTLCAGGFKLQDDIIKCFSICHHGNAILLHTLLKKQLPDISTVESAAYAITTSGAPELPVHPSTLNQRV